MLSLLLHSAVLNELEIKGPVALVTATNICTNAVLLLISVGRSSADPLFGMLENRTARTISI